MKCKWDDCFTCPYNECVEDDLTDDEIALSEKRDIAIEESRKWDSTAVIKTKKVGRPRKLYPKCESEEYKKEKLRKQKEYYHKHKEERLNYQKNYYKEHIKNPEYAQANRERALAYYNRMSDEERAEYNAKQKEYYKKRKAAKEAEKG